MARPDIPVTAAAGLCRDCAGPAPAAGRCPACGSPRVIRHPELTGLAIAHLDCDAFYAAVEKRDNPDLRHVPLIIGGRERGVVTTACYIARIHGVHSAMPMFKALRACPHAVVIPPDMNKYAAVGRQVRDRMRAVSPLVEPLSIDEAFIDLQGTERLHHASPAESLIKLAHGIARDIGITVSIGLSYNKYLAKLASDFDKPDGFSVIGRADAVAVLAPLSVTKIWGVGPALHRRLAADGIATIGQVRQFDEATLVDRYGSIGHRLYRFSRGEDSRHVIASAGAKSVSSETTFNTDVADPEDLARRLWRQCERLSKRLKDQQLAGATVTLKLKTAKFAGRARAATLAAPTQLAETLYRTALPLLTKEADGTQFRLIGIGVTALRPAAEADPPDLADPTADHRKRVEAAIDAVRTKLGDQAITKGRGLR